MFNKLKKQLLLSYLSVFVAILGIFSIAIRIIFHHVLWQQTNDRLTALVQSTVEHIEPDRPNFRIDEGSDQPEFNSKDQSIQWFDQKGRLILQKGKIAPKQPLNLSFTGSEFVYTQGQPRLQSLTRRTEKSSVRYVRVSESLSELDENLLKLDLGLSSGIVFAIGLSGLGGIWLTRRAMKPIEASFDRLKQFTADASHEFRSPLMAIKSNVAVALKYPEEMRITDAEKFQAIMSATNQMTQLTEDLLLLARDGQTSSHSQTVINLTELLAGLIQLYEPQAKEHEIDLQFHITGVMTILGDPGQITRLFTNLISNALKYTENGGTIKVQAEISPHSYSVSITDTGIGISPEHLSRIFDRFWRADQARSYADNSSGLGLAIAQHLAALHQGQISVTSQLGVGSCFTVVLPVSAKV